MIVSSICMAKTTLTSLKELAQKIPVQGEIDVPDVKRSSLAVQHYVSQMVDGVFSQAYKTVDKKLRAQGTKKRVSTSSSCYEDAFDIPYPHLVEYAQSMADDILYQVITQVTALVVKDEKVSKKLYSIIDGE